MVGIKAFQPGVHNLITACLNKGTPSHLDGAAEHLGEPEDVKEIEDQVEAPDEPQRRRRNAPGPRVRQLSAADSPEIQRHACAQEICQH